MTIYGDVWRKVHGTITGRPDQFSWLIESKLAGSAIPTSIDEIEWRILLKFRIQTRMVA